MMDLRDHPALFGFERDFAVSLHCIPMSVRLKLDLCGIKLTLRQWNRVPVGRRIAMLDAPCRDAQGIAAFREALLADIARYSEEPPRLIAPAALGDLDGPADVPRSVNRLAQAQGLETLSREDWSGLAPIKRFALLKLVGSREEHRNFRPALVEFGLARKAGAAE